MVKAYRLGTVAAPATSTVAFTYVPGLMSGLTLSASNPTAPLAGTRTGNRVDILGFKYYWRVSGRAQAQNEVKYIWGIGESFNWFQNTGFALENALQADISPMSPDEFLINRPDNYDPIKREVHRLKFKKIVTSDLYTVGQQFHGEGFHRFPQPVEVQYAAAIVGNNSDVTKELSLFYGCTDSADKAGAQFIHIEFYYTSTWQTMEGDQGDINV